MLRIPILFLCISLMLPLNLIGQSTGSGESFLKVGAGFAPDSPAFGAAVGIRVPVAQRLQITGRLLGWTAFSGGCSQSVPESYSCDIGGYGAAMGLRGHLPKVGPATPFLELSGGGFRSEVAGESNIDPHAAFEVGVAFQITNSIQASLALEHMRVFGSHYEELLDESLTFTGGSIGLSIPNGR